MKDKDTKNTPLPEKEGDDGKIHVSKSVFKTAHELQEEMIAKQEEQQRILRQQAAEREKRKREAYERRLMEEKRELLRLKQGQAEESELIPEAVEEEETKLSLGKKISNFFYHNKWWLGLGAVFVFITCFLIFDLINRDDPDLVVMVVADNAAVGNSQGLSDYFKDFTEDFNGDGEVSVSVYYIPYTESAQKNYANGTDTKLTAEFQSANAMIVIGGELFKNNFSPDEIFIPLEDKFPDNPNVDTLYFSLENTDFASKINVTDDAVGDDLYMAFRMVQPRLYADEEEMQEAFEKDFPVFEKVVADLTK